MSAASRARAIETAPVVEPEVRPDLTVVRRRKARRSMLTRLGTVMLFSLFVVVLGVVVFQTLRVQNQAKLDEIDKRIATENDRTRELRLKLADAMAPEKIAEAARTRLGMVQPNDIAFLQPKADDEAKAAWDPGKEPLPVPTTTAPPAPPTTAAPVPTSTPPVTAAKPPVTAAKPATTPTTKATTPTTKATTPTTKATTPTTKAPPTTTKPTKR